MSCEKNSCQLKVHYDSWLACDRYVCRECGADVLTGFARDKDGQRLTEKDISSMLGQLYPTQFYQHRDLGPAPVIEKQMPTASERLAEEPGPF